MIRSILVVLGLLTLSMSNVAQAEFKEGDPVLAYWEASELYFLATIAESTDDGYLVVFEDGDRGTVPADKIYEPTLLKVGTPVISKWDDGEYYPGKIGKIVGRAYYINYDDGDEGWAPASWIAVSPEEVEN